MIKTVISLCIAVICSHILALGQSQPKRTASVLISALDKNGQTVSDLGKENFQVKLNGRSAPVLGSHYSYGSRRVVVLLDMRNYMKGESINNVWPIARETLENALLETPVSTQVALVTLSSQLETVVDFTKGKSVIEDWVKKGPSQRADIKPCREECTGLLDAISEATKLLHPSQPGDAVYAITRGGDGESDISKTELEKQMLASGIRLFAFLFINDVRFEGEPLHPGPIAEIADETGGAVRSISGREGLRAPVVEFYRDDSTHDQIKALTRELGAEVNGFYTLDLEPSIPPGKLCKVSASVTEKDGKPNKSVATVAYQRAVFTPRD